MAHEEADSPLPAPAHADDRYVLHLVTVVGIDHERQELRGVFDDLLLALHALDRLRRGLGDAPSDDVVLTVSRVRKNALAECREVVSWTRSPAPWKTTFCLE